MSQQDFIRTAHRVYGKSIRQLAKETGHSRNTIRKMLKGEYESYKIRNNQVYPVLGKYVEIIEKWLKSDLQNPRKQRHTARRVYSRLVNEYGFTGAESTVRVHVRKARMKISRSDDKAFIPLCPPIGQEAEIDWGTASESFANLNEKILQECLNYGSHRISGKKRSVSEDFENEKEFLIALPPYRYSNIRTFNGKADKYATVRLMIGWEVKYESEC
ncbi:hypothetical protein QUF76_04700 [Desulfobacterales bacterium HSG16]|nr:hypothetical protein [Desulfobacterales bacterium HSG16]